MWRHKHEHVVIGVVDSEVDVDGANLLEPFDRIGRDYGTLKDLCETGIVLMTEFAEEFFFVGEVDVDGGRRVLDLVGDATHRDAFVTFRDKQLASGVEDLVPRLRLLAFAPFLHAHITTTSNLTMLT